MRHQFGRDVNHVSPNKAAQDAPIPHAEDLPLNSSGLSRMSPRMILRDGIATPHRKYQRSIDVAARLAAQKELAHAFIIAGIAIARIVWMLLVNTAIEENGLMCDRRAVINMVFDSCLLYTSDAADE